MRWINNNTEEVFYIQIGNLLNSLNIDPSSITDVEYLVKTSAAVSDEDANVALSLSNGLTLLTGTTTNIAVKFRPEDYSSTALQVNKTYHVGLRFKTITMDNFFEVELDDKNLNITSSFFTQ